MHDTPQIEDEAVVLRRKRTHAVDQTKGHVVTNLSRELLRFARNDSKKGSSLRGATQRSNLGAASQVTFDTRFGLFGGASARRRLSSKTRPRRSAFRLSTNSSGGGVAGMPHLGRPHHGFLHRCDGAPM